mmetsp:Transcript_52197/g.135122  ORF Transcript_52197/g.135122 Transcript_52197/m.135122 type:complete len:99 (+) Transcript_52197:294-590(+)
MAYPVKKEIATVHIDQPLSFAAQKALEAKTIDSGKPQATKASVSMRFVVKNDRLFARRWMYLEKTLMKTAQSAKKPKTCQVTPEAKKSSRLHEIGWKT